MNLSFADFVNKYLNNSFKLHSYQKEFLKNIQSFSKPINMHEIMLKQRQYNRRFEHMLRLHYNLLKNKSILDLFLALHFKFELNTDNELELVIDEYDPTSRSMFYMGSASVRAINIFKCDIHKECTIKKQSYKGKLEEALEIIKEI